MAGAEPGPALCEEQPTLEQAAEKARRLIEEGQKPSAAAKAAAAGTPYSKSEIYRLLTREEEE